MFKVSWQHWIDIQIVMQRFNFKRRFLRISNFTKWFIWNSLQDDIELLFYTNDDLVKGLMVWVSALQNNGFVWGLFLFRNFIFFCLWDSLKSWSLVLTISALRLFLGTVVDVSNQFSIWLPVIDSGVLSG